MTVYDSLAHFSSVSMVTATLGDNDPEPGLRRTVGDEDYRFVYNTGNSQISPGYGAIVSAVSGYSVTVSSVAGVDACVGVCKHTTLTTGTYGWLLTKGYGQIQMKADASATVGTLIAIDADGAFIQKSISTGYPTPACGVAMAAIGSGVSGTAFISTFF